MTNRHDHQLPIAHGNSTPMQNLAIYSDFAQSRMWRKTVLKTEKPRTYSYSVVYHHRAPLYVLFYTCGDICTCFRKRKEQHTYKPDFLRQVRCCCRLFIISPSSCRLVSNTTRSAYESIVHNTKRRENTAQLRAPRLTRMDWRGLEICGLWTSLALVMWLRSVYRRRSGHSSPSLQCRQLVPLCASSRISRRWKSQTLVNTRHLSRQWTITNYSFLSCLHYFGMPYSVAKSQNCNPVARIYCVDI